MRFHTLVGVLPHEREIAQPLEVDLTARVDTQAGLSALDYRDLYELTAAAARRGTGYLETLADELAGGVLALPGVTEVEVVLRKPHVPLPGPLDCAEVRLVRAQPPADAGPAAAPIAAPTGKAAAMDSAGGPGV